MYSLNDIKNANNIILDDLESFDKYDIGIIRKNICMLKYFFNKKEYMNTIYQKYIKLLTLIYFYFEFDTLENRKYVIILSKKINNIINERSNEQSKENCVN